MSDAGAVGYVRVTVLVGLFFPLALLLSLIVDGAAGNATDDFIAFAVVGSFFLAISAAAGIATMRGERAGALALGGSYVILLVVSFSVFVADLARPERTSSVTTVVMVWFAAMVYLTGGARAAYQRYHALSGGTTRPGQGDDADGLSTRNVVSVDDEYYGDLPAASSGTEYA